MGRLKLHRVVSKIKTKKFEEEKDSYLYCKTCAELVAEVTVSPTRSQKLLLNLAKGCVKFMYIVQMKTRVLHTLEGHTSHGIGI